MAKQRSRAKCRVLTSEDSLVSPHFITIQRNTTLMQGIKGITWVEYQKTLVKRIPCLEMERVIITCLSEIVESSSSIVSAFVWQEEIDIIRCDICQPCVGQPLGWKIYIQTLWHVAQLGMMSSTYGSNEYLLTGQTALIMRMHKSLKRSTKEH